MTRLFFFLMLYLIILVLLFSEKACDNTVILLWRCGEVDVGFGVVARGEALMCVLRGEFGAAFN